jgi:hypothetical protein
MSMTRVALPISAAIGVICAVGLTAIRGGWQDKPSVLAIFGIGGFLASYGIFALLSSRSLHAFEAFALKHEGSQVVRDLAGVILLFVAVTIAGPLVQNAGFSGWLVLLILEVACPLAICVITYDFTLLLGLLSATGMVISALIYDPFHPAWWFQPSAWAHFLQTDKTIAFWLCVIFGCFSFVLCIPIAYRRRRIADGGQRADLVET